MRSAFVLAAALVPLALGACARAPVPVPEIVKPYRITIQQGNYVTREMVEQLKPGMTKEQVRFILGTPLVTDIFHADRWDYVFTFRRQGQEPQQRRLTAFFKADVLERFEADALPTEAEFVASLDAGRKFGKVPPLQATEAQLKAFDDRNKTTAPVEPTVPAATPAASYPPLETPGTAR